MSKLQKKLSALKRVPVLQNLKFLNFFLFLWVISALLDPDSGSDSCGYGSTDLVESGSNPDPKHLLLVTYVAGVGVQGAVPQKLYIQQLDKRVVRNTEHQAA